VKLDVAFEVDSLTVIKEMIEDGDCFAVLADAAIHKEIAAGRLRSIRIVDPEVSRSVALVTSAARGQTRACEEVGRITSRLAHDLLRDGVWKGVQLHPTPDAHAKSLR
jgi:LysR family nitrogen assimilation transcriptional regulator